jgi:hypothetical protein
MKDGLYMVHTNRICAAFVVQDGDVTDCAPILRRKIGYWKRVAKRIATDDNVQDSFGVTPGPSLFSGGGR